jgi:hypothetical protein
MFTIFNTAAKRRKGMKKLLWGILLTAALLMNVGPASADGLTLGNTASDSTIYGNVSMVTDSLGNPVAFTQVPAVPPPGMVTLFAGSTSATTSPPYFNITNPDQADTGNVIVSGSVFYASALNDVEPIATTQVFVNTVDGTAGYALAQSVFFQPFDLNPSASGVYTYNFLTGITGSYFAGDPEGAVSGYSKAKYTLGWWDPSTSTFVTGFFAQSPFYGAVMGQADVNLALLGTPLTYDFSTPGPTGALPTFSAYSESYAQVVPVPSTVLLLGAGLMGLAGYGKKNFLKK